MRNLNRDLRSSLALDRDVTLSRLGLALWVVALVRLLVWWGA